MRRTKVPPSRLRQGPVVEGGAGAADVQEPRGARGESRADLPSWGAEHTRLARGRRGRRMRGGGRPRRRPTGGREIAASLADGRRPCATQPPRPESSPRLWFPRRILDSRARPCEASGRADDRFTARPGPRARSVPTDRPFPRCHAPTPAPTPAPIKAPNRARTGAPNTDPKMADFRIQIERLDGRPEAFVFEASPAWWADRSEGREDEVCVAEAPVHLRARPPVRAGEDVRDRRRMSRPWSALECSRCGKRYPHALREPYRLVLEPAKGRGRCSEDPEGERRTSRRTGSAWGRTSRSGCVPRSGLIGLGRLLR